MDCGEVGKVFFCLNGPSPRDKLSDFRIFYPSVKQSSANQTLCRLTKKWGFRDIVMSQ